MRFEKHVMEFGDTDDYLSHNEDQRQGITIYNRPGASGSVGI
jgi:hypothetical protein